ncbi:MAG: hypothetical protein KZQ64_03370 [gamma proteobacterium symbiont of Bathyaustriella thionipta]|nr:hypothetical protein [gamma proteobacterium symbiont of Bathyaustriella thionipta]MCU7949484.1 hypothetical protein [gamma proteobacterium symbiont of Bathyaustriella thionipta]MCU7952421.1 hypothetical protein [gamma proteobacterium symbiont of Bathyaustriella thionipta]MCU7956070.1 hypothetical protein [gamma proteobacterium symbiont of Bathyaustriella thionipta]MCU7968364.1 hypothetical protein [gamma proteobacterium symbiont of Bathyaustriella thionipta]
MTKNHVSQWLNANSMGPDEVDCATAVMLKILDGKCKMPSEEKVIMAFLYEQLKNQPGKLFHNDIHQFIFIARQDLSDKMRLCIYEKRVMAETIISRPVMKRFKAMIRQTGLIKN